MRTNQITYIHEVFLFKVFLSDSISDLTLVLQSFSLQVDFTILHFLNTLTFGVNGRKVVILGVILGLFRFDLRDYDLVAPH